eukprot:547889-Pleurochrysis_carterae.AAC.2
MSERARAHVEKHPRLWIKSMRAQLAARSCARCCQAVKRERIGGSRASRGSRVGRNARVGVCVLVRAPRWGRWRASGRRWPRRGACGRRRRRRAATATACEHADRARAAFEQRALNRSRMLLQQCRADAGIDQLVAHSHFFC